MENKIDIDTVLKRPYKLCVFIAYNKIKNEEFCTSFVTFYVPVPTFNEGPSSKLDCSIILHEVLHCFEMIHPC